MIQPLIAVPVAVWASTAAAFHPVEDQPYRYDTVETREADGVVRRFHASRSVVFHRTAEGYDAIVTLDALDQHAGGDVGAMFLATTGALLHRPLRYRIDATGAILDVADVEATIAVIADAIERSSRSRQRSGDLTHLASPLRTLPTERKRAMLLSILAPLIADSASYRLPGERPVRLPSRPPLAPGTALAGTERVSPAVAGRITITLRAGGGTDATAVRDVHGSVVPRPGAPVATIEIVRTVDPSAGLVVDSRSVTESILSDGEVIHRSRNETVVALRLAPK